MSTDQEQFLNLKILPARLKVEETAWYLGFSSHDIPILVSESVLKPLGHPPLTGVKYFSVAVLSDLRKDAKWLAKASDCIVQYWQGRNQKKAAPGAMKHRARKNLLIKQPRQSPPLEYSASEASAN